jgi:hypothetical protein
MESRTTTDSRQAPAWILRLELEARPVIIVDTLDDGEADRLADWLRAKPEYAELVERASDLMQRERAA